VGKDMRADILKYRLERQNSAQAYNGEMAKWILASLILVNGAPFLLVSKDMPEFARVLVGHAWYFTLAISLAILCGFSAWLNTGMREAVYGYEVKRLIETADAPSAASLGVTKGERVSGAIVRFAYVSSLITGFGSLAFFLIGTWSLSQSYHGERIPAPAQAAAVRP
jgi:hypothetical protein